MDEGVIDRLRTLGMSLYEARIYLGLLRHGPQNGNEVSKSAGIPSSKVYSHERGVRIFGILYGTEQPPDIGSWLVHSYQKIVADRIGGRIGFDEWDRWWQADPDLRTIILDPQTEEVFP